MNTLESNYDNHLFILGSDKPRFANSEEKGEVFVTPIVEFKECEEIVKNVLSKYEKSPSFLGREIYAFSYYYDRAAEGGLVEFKKGKRYRPGAAGDNHICDLRLFIN